MKRASKLSDVWLKAAVLGANWAASEIILGSFLHNLHIPFKGNILTGIGLLLMIAASYIWKDKGLFWRTGVICALMKTMSPSSVIFGPMVAILMEAILFELSVRFLGRNILGYFLGASLAMAWVLFQKIINYILFYGFNVVDIYAELMRFVDTQLSLNFNMVWMPIFILLGLYVAFGLFIALIGIRIGKNLTLKNSDFNNLTSKNLFNYNTIGHSEFNYSIPWLIFSVFGFVLSLFLIARTPAYIWVPLIILLITTWAIRYKRGLRHLLKPKFWILFLIITMASSFVITYLNGDKATWFDGVYIGIQMNFRAAVVIVGFAVLGTELYNPKIRTFFSQTAFKQLPDALELSLESLPFIISNLPNAKTFIKKPVLVIKLIIYHAEHRFIELKNRQTPLCILITGGIASGKTTFLKELVVRLKSSNINVRGFYSPRVLQNLKTVGYDIVSIETDKSYHFLKDTGLINENSIGRFQINNETLRIGHEILSTENVKTKEIFVIDEVGFLEIKNKGWASSINKLLTNEKAIIVLTVRDDFVDRVIEKFQLRNPKIFLAAETNAKDIASLII
ncbi:MAG: hypothetical protein JEZ09_13405 [Salinivirgaceae bacterium]|nr:hypothetical protein [Salinivirgaceae bacterium]